MTRASRHFRLDLAYDGTGFAGWQLQLGQRTVQGVVESVLSRIQGAGRVRVRGAGRTDSGAHARGQVADFTLETRLEPPELLRSLSKMLPSDVRPRRLRHAPPGFHAWQSAVSKTYRYRLDTSPHGNPMLSRFALHFPYEIDRPAILDALALLPGRRDWSGFAGSACDKDDRVRSLTEARFEIGPGSTASFVFSADGFLTHMVRNLVGALLEIAQGRAGLEIVVEALATGDRNLAADTAPARGLCLESVRYPASMEDAGDVAGSTPGTEALL